MSNSFDILTAVGAALGFLGVLFSTCNLILQQRAERALVKRLRHHQELERLFVGIIQSAHGESLSSEDYLTAYGAINTELQTLGRLERYQVKEALNQPSIKGRENYTTKLVKEAFEDTSIVAS
jgi:hypothetical protein